MTVSRTLRYLWASPASAVGLLLAAIAGAFGARIVAVDGVVEVAGGRLAAAVAGCLGRAASTRSRSAMSSSVWIASGSTPAAGTSACTSASTSAGVCCSLRSTSVRAAGSGCAGAIRIGTTASNGRRTPLTARASARGLDDRIALERALARLVMVDDRLRVVAAERDAGGFQVDRPRQPGRVYQRVRQPGPAAAGSGG